MSVSFICQVFKDYFSSFGRGVPNDIYYMMFAILCLGGLCLIALRGYRVGARKTLTLLLVEYIFLLYCFTVLFRGVNTGQRGCLTPFWSYASIAKGIDMFLLPQIMMNVVVFIPVGFLGGCTFRSHAFMKVFCLGFAVSLSIEAMQYIFQRGFSEFDDVFHNTLGTLMGYGLWKGLSEYVIKKKLGLLKMKEE
jgi:glycopeptide antibiotics resistance protein